MSIYTNLLDAVDNGKKFKVDLVNKSLWIDKKQIIKEGEIVHEQYKSKELIEEWDLEDWGIEMEIDKNPWKLIEFLYDKYKMYILCIYKYGAPIFPSGGCEKSSGQQRQWSRNQKRGIKGA